MGRRGRRPLRTVTDSAVGRADVGIGPYRVHANQQLPIICGNPISIKVYHTFFLHTSSRKTGIRVGFR